MRRILAILFALVFAGASFGQPNPDTLWTRTYGGSSWDEAYSVQQTTDGGYILGGTTQSFGAGVPTYSNLWLVKTNIQGDTLWTRTYGGSYDDRGFSLQPTTDGGYIMAGSTDPFGVGSFDFYMVKTNSQGNGLWTRTFGGNEWDEAFSVQQTADGGYVMAGYTESFGAGGRDFYLVKTNVQGDMLWARTYGGSSDDCARSVQQTDDGGYVVAGYTNSFGAGTPTYANMYLVKTNSQGDTLWTRIYGRNGGDVASSVQQTADGGYILAGWTSPFAVNWADFYLVKTNSQGDTLWTRSYVGSGWDEAYSVKRTADGGYAVAGVTGSFGSGNNDFYLMKTNSQGDTLWTHTYGGSESDYASSVQLTSDGGYIVAGYTESFGEGGGDFYLVKTGPEIVPAEPLKNPFAEDYALYPSYPNPFNPTTTIRYDVRKTGPISLRIFDLLGREMATLVQGTIPAGSYTIAWDGADLPSGIYFCRMEAAGFVQTRKMLLVK